MPYLVIDVGQEAPGRCSSTIHQNINSAEILDGTLYGLLCAGFVAEIGRNGADITTRDGIDDAGLRPFQVGGCARTDGNPGSLFCKCEGYLAANAFASAGDQSDFALKIEVHTCSPMDSRHSLGG